MAEATDRKVCTGCGTDVTDKPRKKDAQGRYYCEACIAKAQAKAPAAAPAPSSNEDPAMAALFASGGGASRAMVPCPSCGVAIPESATVCTSCGFNISTGKSMRTRFTADKTVVDKKSDFKLPISWDVIAGIMLVLVIGTGLWAALHPVGLVAFYLALGLNSLVCYLMLMIIPFQDKQTGWGLFNVFWPAGVVVLVMLKMAPLAGVLSLAAPSLIWYYVFRVNWRDSLKRLYIAGFIGILALAGLFALHGPQRIAESLGMDPKEFDSDDSGPAPSKLQPAPSAPSTPSKGGAKRPST